MLSEEQHPGRHLKMREVREEVEVVDRGPPDSLAR